MVALPNYPSLGSMRALACAVSLVAFGAALACGDTAGHPEKSGDTMYDSQTIDDIVLKLHTAKPIVEDIAHMFGQKISGQEGVFLVQMDRAPFASVKISGFRGDINLYFTLSPGLWRLSDISPEPDAWLPAPLLPDSGQQELVRDWEWRHVAIRCIVKVEGSAPLPDYVIQRVDCQVTPQPRR